MNAIHSLVIVIPLVVRNAVHLRVRARNPRRGWCRVQRDFRVDQVKAVFDLKRKEKITKPKN